MKIYTNCVDQRLTARHKKCMELCNVKNKKILDIGCSFGWFEKFAVESGCKEIIGIDLDESYLLDAKKQVHAKQVKFLKASVLNLSQFKNDYFDIVVMFEVLEHLPKNTEEKCLTKITRILKKNGELYSGPQNSDTMLRYR